MFFILSLFIHVGMKMVGGEEMKGEGKKVQQGDEGSGEMDGREK
jgi:hypothetical protein